MCCAVCAMHVPSVALFGASQDQSDLPCSAQIYTDISSPAEFHGVLKNKFLLRSWTENECGPCLTEDMGRQHAHTLQKLLSPLPEMQQYFISKVNHHGYHGFREAGVYHCREPRVTAQEE